VGYWKKPTKVLSKLIAKQFSKDNKVAGKRDA